MRRQAAGGAVVNFSSVDTFAVSRGQLLFSASKAAVVSLTRSLAIELPPDRIVVNAIEPGWVDTPGNRATGRMHGVSSSIPLGRPAAPGRDRGLGVEAARRHRLLLPDGRDRRGQRRARDGMKSQQRHRRRLGQVAA